MDIIRKTKATGDPAPVLSDYAEARASFSWEKVARELDVPLSGPLNLGTLACSRGGTLVCHGAGGKVERLPAPELTVRSARAANLLAELGVQRGDRVLFMTRPVEELFTGILGTLRMGAAACVSPRARNGDGLRNLLERTGASALVTDPEVGKLVTPIRKSLPRLKQVLTITDSKPPAPGNVSWGDRVAKAADTFEDTAVATNHPALLHYSELGMSGAVTAHRAAFGLANSAATALDLRKGDGVITLSVPGDPLFVPYVLLAPLLIGGTTHAFEDPIRYGKFGSLEDPVHSWYSSVNALDVVLRRDPGLARILEGCRHIAINHPYDANFVVMTQASYGSPMHPTWWCRELGAIQTAEFRSGDIRPGSLGRPLPGVEAKVTPSGHLAIRLGPGAPFAGYWGDGEQTSRRVKEGWFISDQPARMDDDGTIWPSS